MKLEEIRSKFIEYFKAKDHKYFESSGLIPKNDPTLLFTNAGMNQFKNVFLGAQNLDVDKGVSSQKCLRAGGKHNDLDNVGFTYRHHTFFEMLGNFSFGAYFKKEAIYYAWDFLTKILNIPESKLYVTVYKDDDDAYEIWNKTMNIPAEKIFKFGEKDNFWSMGDLGPCGPCSEIFYDHGIEHGCGKESCTVGCDCDRFVEIWNLVFMQFNKDAEGKLSALPKPSIDTGSGLERLTAVMQAKASNYDIDLFISIKNEIAKNAKHNYSDKKFLPYYNAIADHLRAAAFLISEGCIPSNEGAAYVLRRIIRRAIRSGKLLGFKKPFLYEKVSVVINLMGESYPQLFNKKEEIVKVLKLEEEKFFETLEKGLDLLEKETASLNSNIFPGEHAFKLHDTYGFPLDLTKLILKEKNIDVDEVTFNKAMSDQKVRGKSGAKNLSDTINKLEILISEQKIPATSVLGYDFVETNSKLIAIIKNNKIEAELNIGEEGILIFDKTPMYAESGGQVCDYGVISNEKVKANVIDVFKTINTVFLHKVKVEAGTFKTGVEYFLKIDQNRRNLISRNHTATHLLHYALRKFLGAHVKQAGSYVADTFFRFDFSHFEKVSAAVLKQVEIYINELILSSSEVNTKYLAYKEAVSDGTIALFDEKYGDTVRLVNIGNYSKELCGGTHVTNIKDIGIFKIKAEASTGSGVRRIEALTSFNAYLYLSKTYDLVETIVKEHKLGEDEILEKINSLLEDNKKIKKELEMFKTQNVKADLEKIIDTLNREKIVVSSFNIESKQMIKEISEQLKPKIEGVIVLFSNTAELLYFAMVSSIYQNKISASDIVKFVSSTIGGKGGGKADFAQGGGGDFSIINEAKILDFIKTKIEV